MNNRIAHQTYAHIETGINTRNTYGDNPDSIRLRVHFSIIERWVRLAVFAREENVLGIEDDISESIFDMDEKRRLASTDVDFRFDGHLLSHLEHAVDFKPEAMRVRIESGGITVSGRLKFVFGEESEWESDTIPLATLVVEYFKRAGQQEGEWENNPILLSDFIKTFGITGVPKALADDMKSIGWLNGTDDTIILTPVFNDQMHPCKVRIPKAHFDDLEGDETLMKGLAAVALASV